MRSRSENRSIGIKSVVEGGGLLRELESLGGRTKELVLTRS